MSEKTLIEIAREMITLDGGYSGSMRDAYEDAYATNNIVEFCKEYDACSDGRDWAIANCKDMSETWEKARPVWLVWIATRYGVMTKKQRIEFSVECCKPIMHLMRDRRSRKAVCVAHRYAQGRATEDELNDAMTYAYYAAYDASYSARAAAYYATCGAAYAVAEVAVQAELAVQSALAARFEAYLSYFDTCTFVRKKQADWLRANIKNPFIDSAEGE